ncbi:hypothetical protein [Thermosulfuriphilus sp.]
MTINIHAVLNELISISKMVKEALERENYGQISALLAQRASLYHGLRERASLDEPGLLPLLEELRRLETEVEAIARQKRDLLSQKMAEIPRKKEALKAYEANRLL